MSNEEETSPFFQRPRGSRQPPAQSSLSVSAGNEAAAARRTYILLGIAIGLFVAATFAFTAFALVIEYKKDLDSDIRAQFAKERATIVADVIRDLAIHPDGVRAVKLTAQRLTNLNSATPVLQTNGPAEIGGSLRVLADFLVTGHAQMLGGGTWGTLQINGTANANKVVVTRNHTTGEALAAGSMYVLHEPGMRTNNSVANVSESLALLRGLEVRRWRWNGTGYSADFAGVFARRVTAISVPSSLFSTSQLARDLLTTTDNSVGATNNTGQIPPRLEAIDIGAILAHVVAAVQNIADRLEALE